MLNPDIILVLNTACTTYKGNNQIKKKKKVAGQSWNSNVFYFKYLQQNRVVRSKTKWKAPFLHPFLLSKLSFTLTFLSPEQCWDVGNGGCSQFLTMCLWLFLLITLRLQFFKNCSRAGPFHGVQSYRNRLIQCRILQVVQVGICFTLDFLGLQGDSLPHHSLRPTLQGNLLLLLHGP